ncbi:ABC transporter ATP-binding protein [Xanthobacter dioxanivorans]|uniref:ABC transporter ATP-binding protein n=1 Tax=Xanthobacter dioxanivorans TaxID=2528964 RepID=A0A974SLR1_9HYPH|nr:ABC transporter ATP-binding protein [Xanthobacter dioxanivorans]QRG09877.1 ABC transporter ATP-binding protein [Xanthobacter dioxanivorans]
MRTDAPKISIDGLSKVFSSRSGTVTALDSVSLRIAPGTFCVVVGPSGCGKTTLLRIVAGLEQQSSGNFHIARQDPRKPLNSMVFQGDSIFPWMTVWDNAAYGLKMRGAGRAEIKDVVSHYLDRTGLRRFADYYPHQLSGGMRQRVSIARAFANDPEVLFMDEPFSALDEQNKVLLQEELLRIWEEHKKTVIFITHSVDEAVTLGDQIVVMTAHPGRIKAIVDIDFPRPRNILELRRDPKFGELVFTIWGYLRAEVDLARKASH